ncbi:MAG: hypothetical protein ACI9G6_000333 [Limisphaerales bacterium]
MNGQLRSEQRHISAQQLCSERSSSAITSNNMT